MLAVAFAAMCALTNPLSAGAKPLTGPEALRAFRTHIPASLKRAAVKRPTQRFRVIVQADESTRTAELASDVEALTPSTTRSVTRRFRAVGGVAATLTGRQLVELSKQPGVLAITRDAPVRLAAAPTTQKWPIVAGVPKFWRADGSEAVPATIAIIDSGIDATRTDFGGRVKTQVELITSGGKNSPGDGRGHGTFVASIAAGSAPRYFGAAPTAPLVSVDVVDDSGLARTSDVIAGADWVLKNKDRYDIRVANFSLHSTAQASFMFDPLDKAVERLWFAGVVVVAAAGNYGVNGAPSGMPYAPGNDPFIITVGASDILNSVSTGDDTNAPWSAYGTTLDGFQKPDLGAPGRYIVGAVPTSATLTSERPQAVVSPGYMQLSGTSFSAPVVAGAAAQLLGVRPELTPDQVKGALMVSVKATPSAAPHSMGVGEVDVARAARVENPPNPNAGLRRFLVSDPAGGALPVFDAEAWRQTAQSDPAWDTASWTSASWTSASWTSASWTSASWTSASWTSASWTSASQTDASWLSTSQSDASWLSNAAESDTNAAGGYIADVATLQASELEFGVDLDGDGLIGLPATTAVPTTTPTP